MKNIVVCFLISFFGALALEACAPINGEVETPRTAASASSATTSGAERSPSSPTPTTGVGDECGTSRDPVVLARCHERRSGEVQELLRNNAQLTQAVTRVSAACQTSRDPAVRALCDAVNRVAPRPTAVTTAVAPAPTPAPVAQPPAAPAPALPNAGVLPMGMPMPGMGGTQTPFRVTPGGTIGNIAYSGTPAWALQGGIVGLAPFTITLVDVPFAVRVFVNGVAVCHTDDGINFTQVTFNGETFCVVPPSQAHSNTFLRLLARNPAQQQVVHLYGYHYNSYAGGVTGPAGGVTVRITPAQERDQVTPVSYFQFR